jgi:hypothetical protein
MAVTVGVLGMSAFCAGLAGAEQPDDIQRFIQHLDVGEPVYYNNLTIIPVYTQRLENRREYMTLDDALANGWLTISEVDEGRVPQVELNNYSKQTVYIMGGEIISGGKQDRIFGREVLLGPGAKHVLVPVYCVEENRWQYETDTFYSKQNLGTWNLRSTAQVAPEGAQAEIWGDISAAHRDMGVRSRTMAYQEAYEQKGVREKVVEHERYFQNIPTLHRDTIGVVVGVGGQIVSVDLFTDPSIFQALWPKILKSSALAAVSGGRGGSVTQDDAARFIRRLYDARYQRKTAVDLGVEFSAYEGVNVNALVYKNAVIHLSAFSQEKNWKQTYFSPDTERRIPVMRR